MVTYKSPFWDAFRARADLQKYGAEALLLFALQLRFGLDDIDIVASTSLTAGGNDKKADLVYIDTEMRRAVIAQSYVAERTTGKDGEIKKEAPSNKASDLNTAVAWLFTRPIDGVPENLRPHAQELRQSLADKEIINIQFWYVHNLPESKNVKKELETVEHSALTILKANYPDCDIQSVQSLEIGISVLEDWYRSISTPILVNKEFTIPVPGGYEIGEADWKAYTTAVPAKWLYELYATYKTDLLSANVREYLGSRNVDRNINYGIKQTAYHDPEHFWVFNNGITALVHDYKEHFENGKTLLTLQGISVVNGAQTIGAIGSLDSLPDDKAMVQVRFITCNSKDTVYNIVRFNNSQNRITAPDFRSTDPIQTRLTEEFNGIPGLQYVARRGGYEDIIKRQSDTLASITAGQALAAFHGDPDIAYHEKTHMWEEDKLYSKYFNPFTTAKHVLFTYSLLKSVENKKLYLITKSKSDSLIDIEKSQLEFFRKRGSTFMLSSAVSKCLEIILNKPIPDAFRLEFQKNINLDEAITHWNAIVEAASAFTDPLAAGLADGFKARDNVEQAIITFRSLIGSTKQANATIYANFVMQVK